MEIMSFIQWKLCVIMYLFKKYIYFYSYYFELTEQKGVDNIYILIHII